MSKPIADHAEVSIDFPDKFYHGSFGRESRFDVRPESEGIVISLDRSGEQKRHVAFHVHYYLLEDLLGSIADALKDVADLPSNHRERLRAAAGKLSAALD